jgi:hypothetical protein
MRKEKKKIKSKIILKVLAVITSFIGTIFVIKGIVLTYSVTEFTLDKKDRIVKYNSPITLKDLNDVQIKNYTFWSGYNSEIDYDSINWFGIKNEESLVLTKIEGDSIIPLFYLPANVSLVKRFGDSSYLFIQDQALWFLNSNGDHGVLFDNLLLSNSPRDIAYDNINKIIYVLTSSELVGLNLQSEESLRVDLSSLNVIAPAFWDVNAHYVHLVDKKDCVEIHLENLEVALVDCTKLPLTKSKYVIDDFRIYDFEEKAHINILVNVFDKVFLGKEGFFVNKTSSFYFNSQDEIFNKQIQGIFTIENRQIMVGTHEIILTDGLPVSIVSYTSDEIIFSSDTPIEVIPLFGVLLN